MRTLLLVDASMAVYRSMFAHPTLSSGGMFTGALYGMVQMLCSAIQKYSPSAVVVCYDHPPYWRSKELPTYKSGRVFRESTQASHMTQHAKNMGLEGSHDHGLSIKALARDSCERFKVALVSLGIPFHAVEGLEADDLIACGVREFSCEFERTIILSYDSDLYQLLDGHEVYMVRKKGNLYGREDFVQEFGIAPDKWAEVLSLMGSHNGVPGIKGIGPKKAVALVKDLAKDKELEDSDIVVLVDFMDRNMPLIILPHPGVETAFIMDRIDMMHPEERTFMRWLHTYGIEYSPLMMEAVQTLKQNIRRHGTTYE